MGAWSSLVLSVDTLKGLSPLDWPAANDQDDVDTLIVAQAKQFVESIVGSRIATVIAGAGGTEAFFDSCAGVAALATDLQNLVGLAYLYHWWSDPGSRPGTGQGYAKKAAALLGTLQAPGQLTMAAKAFAGIAPVLTEDVTEPQGVAGGGALMSSVDRYSTTT